MTCNSSGQFSRCSHRPPKTPPKPSRISARRRSNSSSTAPAFKCTGQAMKFGCIRGNSTTLPAAVPEIVEAVRALPGKELILDGEVLSLQPDGRPQPFQVTMRRFGRKLDVDRMRAEQPMQPVLVRPPVSGRRISDG